MADTNIDALQAQLTQQQTEAVRMQALQQVLEAFAPGTLAAPVAYRVLLHRVRTLLDEAIAGTTTESTETTTATESPEGDVEDV